MRVRVESLLYRYLEVAPDDNLACLLNLRASEKFLVVPGHPYTDARTHDESAHAGLARVCRPSGITGTERNDVHASCLRAGICQYSLRFAVMRTRHHGERQLRTRVHTTHSVSTQPRWPAMATRGEALCRQA